jgi:NADH-quinone oxidoreductase subunit N
MKDLFDISLSNYATDMMAFFPELLICFAIVLMLFLRIFKMFKGLHMGSLALVFTLFALAVSVMQWLDLPGIQDLIGKQPSSPVRVVQLFGGMLMFDHFTIYLRMFLFGFTALIIWLTLATGIPDRDDSPDFHCLLLGAVLGMAIMVEANHLLMIYLGVEMASLPSYALAGFLKGRRQSSEAALKYVVYGGGASGVMLYGISLLAGKFGTAYLPDLAIGIVANTDPAVGTVFDPVVILALMFILIGIAFKLSAVPFHFWCPDVFEGAAAEVAGFLSVASKGAALAMLVRILMMFSGQDDLISPFIFAGRPNWVGVTNFLIPAIAFFAALTATFGNLAAMQQTNVKRLLAYSTIAHAGYMMMGLATLNPEGVAAVMVYLVAYLFMNLGAFAVVAFIRNQTHSEELDSYRGLIRRSPWMVIALCICLLSLLGIPPLIGFPVKFLVFIALWHTGSEYWRAGSFGLATTLIGLIVIGGINTVISAVYYLKVMRVMIIESRVEDIEGREPKRLPEPWLAVTFASLVALVVVVGIAAWPWVGAASEAGTERYTLKHQALNGSAAPGPAPGPPGGGPGGGGGRPGGGRPGGGGPGGGRPGGGRGGGPALQAGGQ